MDINRPFSFLHASWCTDHHAGVDWHLRPTCSSIRCDMCGDPAFVHLSWSHEYRLIHSTSAVIFIMARCNFIAVVAMACIISLSSADLTSVTSTVDKTTGVYTISIDGNAWCDSISTTHLIFKKYNLCCAEESTQKYSHVQQLEFHF